MDGKKIENLGRGVRGYWWIFAGALFFFLRLPSLFEPFTYGDEGIYLTIGLALRRGLVLYRDIHDNKPPLLYLMAALAGSFPNYRLLLFFWGAATIFLFYKLARMIFPEAKFSLVSTLIFTFLTSLHTFEGNIGNAENFMLLPTIAGFIFLIRGLPSTPLPQKTGGRLFYTFFGGTLFSLAALFKIPAVFDFLAAMIFLISENFSSRGKVTIRQFLAAAGGFIIPIFLSFLYFFYQNTLDQYFTAAFAQNLPYLSSWGQAKTSLGLPVGLFARFSLAVVISLAILFSHRRLALTLRLIIIWFSWSLFAALLSSRPYPHYLIQVLPPLSLSLAFLANKRNRFLALISVAVFILVFINFHFWYYPNFSYYQNFYEYALGGKTKARYYSAFDSNANDLYLASKYLKTHTLPEEKIFIWGNDPSIYALSQRLPLGRYTVAYHIIDFNAYDEALRLIEENSPRYLILSQTESRPFPQLKNFVSRNYRLEKLIGSYQIFHRII